MALGGSYAEFWDFTFRDYGIASRGMAKRQETDIAWRRVLQQEMATLMAFAFNQPNSIPDLTDASRRQDGGGMSEEQSAAQLFATFSDIKTAREQKAKRGEL